LKRVEVEGWKGQGTLEIYQDFTEDFQLIEHIKEKETGKIYDKKTTVLKEDVNTMLKVIRELPINVKYKCYYIAKKLGYEEWKDLWADRKTYFKIYYYPIKVLESLNIIQYFGRGSIMRLK